MNAFNPAVDDSEDDLAVDADLRLDKANSPTNAWTPVVGCKLSQKRYSLGLLHTLVRVKQVSVTLVSPNSDGLAIARLNREFTSTETILVLVLLSKTCKVAAKPVL